MAPFPMYAFLFDKRALTLLIGGLVSLGALLFGAGLLVGLHRNLPEVRAAQSLGPTLPDRPARTPRPPAATAPAQPSDTDAAGGAAAPASVQPADDTESPSRDAVPPPLAAPPAPRPLVMVEHRAPQGPEPTAAARRRASAASVVRAATGGEGAFTLQVGAYAVEDNAQRRASSLSRRGLTPEIVELERPGGAPLHVVRVGHFATAVEAAQAAADFTAAGGGEAMVRPAMP